MSEIKDISILTAVYNDWESLCALLPKLDEELSSIGIRAKVVVIDDGSQEFADQDKFKNLKLTAIESITLITLMRNLGNQRALAVGFGYIASEMPERPLIVMDSDLEDQPEYIPALLETLAENSNKIVFAERTQRSEGTQFKIFYGIYKRVYKLLTGMPIAIGNFSAIPGRLVKRIAGISEIWSHFPAGIMRARVPYITVPSIRGKRLYGQSTMNFVALIVHGLSGLAVHADIVGVRIILAILGLAMGLIIAIIVVVLKRFFFDFFVIGWTSQVIIILGIALLQVFILAIFMAFLVLNGKTQRLLIPCVDYKKFILDTEKITFTLAENSTRPSLA
jgi:polyisoprenyl-phosphate glycosyltransferase